MSREKQDSTLALEIRYLLVRYSTLPVLRLAAFSPRFSLTNSSPRGQEGEISLADEHLPGVHVLEAQALQKALRLLVALLQLQFDDLVELLLHLPHDVRQEELAESLALVVAQHLEIENA